MGQDGDEKMKTVQQMVGYTHGTLQQVVAVQEQQAAELCDAKQGLQSVKTTLQEKAPTSL